MGVPREAAESPSGNWRGGPPDGKPLAVDSPVKRLSCRAPRPAGHAAV